MGKLFWRIFLSFGAAMAVILVIAIAVSFRLAEQLMQSDGLEGRTAAVREAAQALELGGRAALRDWLQRNPRLSPRRELLIIDEQGEEILGRPLPRRVRPLLGPRPHRDARPAPANFRAPRFTPQLIAPDGSSYRLLSAPAGPSPLGILGWPTARLVWLITAVLVAGLVSLLLARYVTAPIGRLQTASRALAAGQLSTRIGASFTGRHDEIAALAADFDRMAERLEQLVTQREILLRDVSHELRSPLTRLRMALALAQRRGTGPAEDDLRRIELEADRLENLISQVLELARIDMADHPSPRESMDLSQVIDAVVADARYEQPDRQIRWSGAGPCLVRGDPAALASAIENVVRNALAHSPSDRAVTVELRSGAGDEVQICVSDRGPGVAETDLERIFEPFFQIEPSRGHESGGFGVGLAISARIVRLHGGHIDARNRPGGGLQVCLTLPAQHHG